MASNDLRKGPSLPQLADVEMISSRVMRILGGNPGKFTLQGTNTYIVGRGQTRILIDTGEGKPQWINDLKKSLQRENITISKAIITHWHHDHQGGVKHLLEISPDTTIYKNKPEENQNNIEDGQVFKVDGATLRAVFSPGHTQDHMSLVLEEEDAMFTGDNVLGHGTAVFEDLSIYLNSLEKMKNMFKGRAYPGHGPVIHDGPSKIIEYIKHRKQREDQVLEVLRSSKASSESTKSDEWTSMEIVKIVYRDVPENLHLPANGGVIQILQKLEEEDKVVKDPQTDGWSIKKRPTL